MPTPKELAGTDYYKNIVEAVILDKAKVEAKDMTLEHMEAVSFTGHYQRQAHTKMVAAEELRLQIIEDTTLIEQMSLWVSGGKTLTEALVLAGR